MEKFLFKVSIDFNLMYRGDKSPVYAVAENKKEAEEYVGKYLEDGCKVKAVTLLGEKLGKNLYHGKPKIARPGRK